MTRTDIKIAWRNLAKRRGTTLINILGLAIGFASAILVFLFVNFHLSFDKFHANGDRIYRFLTDEHMDQVEYEASVPPGFANVIRNDFTFAETVGKMATRYEIQLSAERDGQPVQIIEDVQFVDSDFFRIFQFPVHQAEPGAMDAPFTAFISEDLAKRMYGEASPIGKTFVLDNAETIRVAGIVDPIPDNSMIWGEVFVSYPSMATFSEFLGSEVWSGISSNLQVFGLFHPGQDPEAVESLLAPLPDKYRPNSRNRHHYRVQALPEAHLDGRYFGGINPRVLWIVSLIGLFVLGIACINFINISTAQSAYRSREVGVRKVLGGQRSQLFRQFLSEVFLLVVLALLAGLGCAWLALPAFNGILDLDLGLDGLFSVQFAAFLFVLLLSVTLMAGVYPGIVLGRISPILAIKRKLTQRDSGGLLTRKILVTTQFAISMVLIIATVVVGRQIDFAVNSDLGYDTSVLMVPIAEEIELSRLEAMKNRLVASGAITSVSACLSSPGAPVNSWGTGIRYDRRPEVEPFSIQVKMADKSYLETFGLELAAGRNFNEKRDTVDEVLVNRAFGRMLGIPDPETLLGKEVAVSGGYVTGRIVGVVEDFHDGDFSSRISPIFIAPESEGYNELAIKFREDRVSQAIEALESEWRTVFPAFAFNYEFLDERVSEQYESEQQFLALGKIFSLMAVFIGCLGIYGLVSFFIVQKTKEIGIRKVLGGSLGNILGLFTRDFLKLIGLAALVAIPLAWYTMDRWLRNYEYRTSMDWWVFGIGVGLVLAITMGIIVFQGMRAARANPVNSLRSE